MCKLMQLSLFLILFCSFAPTILAESEFTRTSALAAVSLLVSNVLLWQANAYFAIKECRHRFKEELAKIDEITQKVHDEPTENSKGTQLNQDGRKEIARELLPIIENKKNPKNSFPLVDHRARCIGCYMDMKKYSWSTIWQSDVRELKTKMECMLTAIEESESYKDEQRKWHDSSHGENPLNFYLKSYQS